MKILLIILFWVYSALAQVTASWDAVPEAEGYKIYWRIESGNYSDFETTYSEQIQIPMVRFERERTYFFAVTAFNQAGESEFSKEIPFFIPTGIKEIDLNLDECDEVKSFNILLQRVDFDRTKLPTGSYFHVCWVGGKVVGVKREGLLK